MSLTDVFRIASAVIFSLGGGAALVFGLSSWLGKVWAGRILEKEKAAYANELESLRRTYTEEIERLRTELQKSAFEHQIRFSWYHQRKAELIANIYALLNDVNQYVREMVSPLQTADQAARQAHAKATFEIFNKLAAEYWGKKIFLEKDICAKIESILKTVRDSISDFQMSQDRDFKDTKLWAKAYKAMDKEVPPLLTELEDIFRTMLSHIGPAA